METSVYRAPDKTLWVGRKDSHDKERFYQVVQFYTQETFAALTPFRTPPVVLLGFASDEGVYRNQGRIGASFGPQALRKALGNFPLSGQSLNHIELIDLGDIVCANNDLENAQQMLGALIELVLSKGAHPLVLGGGHETSYGHYLGLHPRIVQKNFAIMNFDAHFDMRETIKDQLGSSGSPFLQIARLRHEHQLPFHYYCAGIKDSSNTPSVFQTAQEWKVQYLRCDDILANRDCLDAFIARLIDDHQMIYVTLCLDVFTASVAPGVSAASPYGLDPYPVINALRKLAQSGKVLAMDVVELAPNIDRDNITAKLAALCVAEFIYHWRIATL